MLGAARCWVQRQIQAPAGKLWSPVRSVSHAVGERGAQYIGRPKVELHRHLEGAIRLRTVIEEA